MRGKIFFISGPSGVGKGTLISKLAERHPEFRFPPSCTTRTKRPGEMDGKTYFFISLEEFKKKIKAEEFLEYAEVHGGNLYGTLKKLLLDPIEQGQIVVREFDVQGFAEVRKKLPGKDYVSIFLTPAGGAEELIHRIRGRAPISDDELARRFKSMEKELGQAKFYDYKIVVVEGEIEKMVIDAEKIILSEVEKLKK